MRDGEDDKLLGGTVTMRRRQETLSEKVYRFRGVILVVSVPLVLITIVWTLMPRSIPLEPGQNLEDPLDRNRASTVAATKAAAGTGGTSSEKYAVVIDCGSTGSRIHVYKFNSKLELQQVGDELELFKQLKPGLSKYAEEPKKGGDSLRELLNEATKAIPEGLQKSTPVVVGATAGLRLLSGNQAEQLLDEVRKMLKDYPFTYTAESVKILDGADEGSFAWVTVNFLLGFLGQAIEDTVGVVDLGGGSVQLTYAVPDEIASKAPDGYVRTLSGMGKQYNVYVHSYLGYGLMAARAAMLDGADQDKGHPCLAKGFSGTYPYAHKEYPFKAQETGADATLCEKVAVKALKLEGSCSFEKCSFNGVWNAGGGVGLDKVYVASYFFDRAGQLGVIPDSKVSSVETTPAEFGKAASKVCSTPLATMEKDFPEVKKDDAGYACMDISYQYTLLTKGFGIDPEKKVTLVKQIAYKGQNVEAAWPLGAAIAAMG